VIVVRRLQDGTAGLGDRLVTGGRRSDPLLTLEWYRDRREVGLGLADPPGKGLKAIAVRLEVDGLLGVEVRLFTGAGERDVRALARGVG
jgi:hypothetical protein